MNGVDGGFEGKKQTEYSTKKHCRSIVVENRP